MIPVQGLEAICKEIEVAVKDYRLDVEDKGVEGKPVTVYRQHIPDEDFEQDSFYPLVIVNVAKVTDNLDGKSIVEVNLCVGVFGEHQTAWMDLLSIMERIRQHLCVNKVIGNKYHVQMPMEWETAEKQPIPYWFGYGAVKFVVGQPRRYDITAPDFLQKRSER